MGLIEGLAAINAKVEANQNRATANPDYVKATWFKLADGRAVSITPLQELDKGNPAYSEKNGVGVMAVEHNNPAPGLWKNKALCSLDDEGRCLACERHAQNPKAGWKQKTRLYMNVLVDDGSNDPYVAVLSSGFGKGQVAPSLLEFLNDVEEGEPTPSLTKTKFRIKRTGSELSDTSYTTMPKGASKVNVEDFELFDLHKILRNVPYGEQEQHYDRGAVNAADEGQETPVRPANPEAEW